MDWLNKISVLRVTSLEKQFGLLVSMLLFRSLLSVCLSHLCIVVIFCRLSTSFAYDSPICIPVHVTWLWSLKTSSIFCPKWQNLRIVTGKTGVDVGVSVRFYLGDRQLALSLVRRSLVHGTECDWCCTVLMCLLSVYSCVCSLLLYITWLWWWRATVVVSNKL